MHKELIRILCLYCFYRENINFFQDYKNFKKIPRTPRKISSHGGSLETALEIVRQTAKAGADCLKIQTYTADSLTIDCDKSYFKIKGGLWDGYTLYDLYKYAGTPYEWHKAIKDECDKCGIYFLSTPFDANAVDFLEELGTEAYKIASFELNDIMLIEYAASKGKPMIPPAFANIDSGKIGITAGASTPTDSLKEVVTRMSEMEHKDLTQPVDYYWL